jgi:eukaryotic-like serine/threonine-protein kinase
MTPERFRQVSDLFHAALSRDDGTRTVFLDEACGTDASLRDEVMAMLAAHRAAGPFGQEPVRVPSPVDAIPLANGTTLGPYRIEAPLGAGGMGEVYKAIDGRLERTVAIKVLPGHVASDLESRQRFEREAKTIASLSHPHICPLFDVGEQDGIHFLVMEYLEGETLAHRLKSGPLPLPHALRHATEIADALDKAHRRGVVHRDLKPANIMMTAAGAKLLDFGLAKLARRLGGPESPTRPPATDEPLTGQGTLVGTLPYMSPEQVEGRDADARTDIFAFGAVLYEMVTGARAFESPGQANLIAAILKDEVPPASARQRAVSPALDGAIRRCLAKDREERWQSASDLTYEIQRIAAESSQERPPAAPTATNDRRHRRERFWWAASLLAVGIAAGWFGVASVRGSRSAVSGTAVRFPVALPDGLRLTPTPNAMPIAVSPGGERIVFSAVDASATSRLYVREIQAVEIRALPGTEGGFGPFFSPDGAWIGFAVSGALKKVKINGGDVLTIAEKAVDNQFGGAAWGDDGTIVFAPTRIAGLSRVPATGGIPAALTAPDGGKGEVSHFLPEFLPGGRAVLFTMRAGLNAAPARVEAVSLDTGERHVIAERGINAHYAPTGHVVFAGDGLLAGSLWTVPFDPKTLRATGPEVRVLDSLQSPRGVGSFTMAGSGTLVYVPRGARAPEELVWVDGNASAEKTLIDTPGNLIFPRFSPDGKRLAVTIRQGGDRLSGIWIVDLERSGAPVLFSSQSRNDHLPVWTPDGTRVVFSSVRDGGNRDATAANLYWKRLDDSGEAERLTQSPRHQDPGSWSPDGNLLTFAEQHPDSRWDVWLLDMKDRRPRPLIRTAASERHPMISPDGRWLAYASDENGVEEVYVQAFPDGGQKLRVSRAGGNEPLWARDGRRLFYRRAKDVVAVGLTSGPALSIGPSSVFASGSYEGAAGNGAPNYELSADGRRFVMVRRNDLSSVPDTRLDVVVNWLAELLPRLRAN